MVANRFFVLKKIPFNAGNYTYNDIIKFDDMLKEFLVSLIHNNESIAHVPRRNMYF